MPTPCRKLPSSSPTTRSLAPKSEHLCCIHQPPSPKTNPTSKQQKEKAVKKYRAACWLAGGDKRKHTLRSGFVPADGNVPGIRMPCAKRRCSLSVPTGLSLPRCQVRMLQGVFASHPCHKLLEAAKSLLASARAGSYAVFSPGDCRHLEMTVLLQSSPAPAKQELRHRGGCPRAAAGVSSPARGRHPLPL